MYLKEIVSLCCIDFAVYARSQYSERRTFGPPLRPSGATSSLLFTVEEQTSVLRVRKAGSLLSNSR
ncbi:hypothetical protein CY34DRAFT_565607 [Suillus luteus UH-Slu-Lm8-n1]|uniref:Uncharacterized protein n=1 Tax=Suillus luteus UH-Slu-Lm8-n1 TaxID=930992 RepID=A0A0D0AC08_9AGAM|nr:hypothetical protein CY34DRAFT_565607 [Suillus luteus UH-Slu-Lm8-n1]